MNRREALERSLHYVTTLATGLTRPDGRDDVNLTLPALLCRRDFIGLALSNIVLLTNACRRNEAPKNVPVEPTRESKNLVSVAENTPPLTKSEVRGLLENLQDNPYKKFVMQYGHPLLADNTPKSIFLAGENIQIADVGVVDVPSPELVFRGTFSMRVNLKTQQRRLISNHLLDVFLPFITPEAQPFVARVSFEQNGFFAEGIEPQISWIYPKSGLIPQDKLETYKKWRKFALIKEGFSLAFAVAYMESVIQQMRMRNMPIHFNEGDTNLEGVSQGLLAIGLQAGRFTAMHDIGPFLLAAKAIQTDGLLLNEVRAHFQNARALDAIKHVDFGVDPKEMVQKTMEYMLQNKELVKGTGALEGDLEKLP